MEKINSKFSFYKIRRTDIKTVIQQRESLYNNVASGKPCGGITTFSLPAEDGLGCSSYQRLDTNANMEFKVDVFVPTFGFLELFQ